MNAMKPKQLFLMLPSQKKFMDDILDDLKDYEINYQVFTEMFPVHKFKEYQTLILDFSAYIQEVEFHENYQNIETLASLKRSMELIKQKLTSNYRAEFSCMLSVLKLDIIYLESFLDDFLTTN
jgi:hypothetical protein